MSFYNTTGTVVHIDSRTRGPDKKRGHKLMDGDLRRLCGVRGKKEDIEEQKGTTDV